MRTRGGRMQARCGRIWSRPRVPPSPCTDFLQKSGRISCRKGLETPLAAGLAASAGGLGSLEALAVHPWALEFLYAAIIIDVFGEPPHSVGKERKGKERKGRQRKAKKRKGKKSKAIGIGIILSKRKGGISQFLPYKNSLSSILATVWIQLRGDF